jgi:hypothetical protein
MNTENRTETIPHPPELNLPRQADPSADRRHGSHKTRPDYRIPAPPVPGRTAWSLDPWLPD